MTESAVSIRPLNIQASYLRAPAGSALISCGNTRVICSAQVQPGAPRWKIEQGVPGGWVTAEYSMLPGSTQTRKSRERNRTDSRSIEIQRLIGRALRSAVDLEKIGDVSIYIDCDVLDADGGTRCASINGGMVALYEALLKMQREAVIEELPVTAFVAAISVGLRDGQVILDLDYEADSTADVDMNVVMNENGDLIEVQGTAEHHPFSRSQLDAMLDLAWEGIRLIIAEQKRVIATLN